MFLSLRASSTSILKALSTWISNQVSEGFTCIRFAAFKTGPKDEETIDNYAKDGGAGVV